MMEFRKVFRILVIWHRCPLPHHRHAGGSRKQVVGKIFLHVTTEVHFQGQKSTHKPFFCALHCSKGSLQRVLGATSTLSSRATFVPLKAKCVLYKRLAAHKNQGAQVKNVLSGLILSRPASAVQKKTCDDDSSNKVVLFFFFAYFLYSLQKVSDILTRNHQDMIQLRRPRNLIWYLLPSFLNNYPLGGLKRQWRIS